MFKALAASGGFSLGRAFVYTKPDLSFTARDSDDAESEVGRYLAATKAAAEELKSLTQAARGGMGEELAHIFRSQQTMAEDESTSEEVCAAIRGKGICAEQALSEVFDAYRSLFAEMGEDDYNKARGVDIDDVYKRILRLLLGLPESDLSKLKPGTIVVAEELFPSDTALLDPGKVIGLITSKGGVTSHVAIVAKNLGIPAAVGLKDASLRIPTGARVVLDATDGAEAAVYVDPDSKELERLQRVREGYEARLKQAESAKGLEPVTTDGHRLIVSANIGSDSEAVLAKGKGATSVGLFRSEFLFLGKTKLPDEEMQFRAYKAAAETFANGFVIIRTLDVGGDKQVPSLSIPEEDNPFLGYRALRVSLDRSDIFVPQLRAILRASHFGTVKMMFPMVSGVSEVKSAYTVLEKCKRELRAEGKAFDEKMEVGVMVEIPSAVFMAGELAEIVDFFSIGTNDLTQYLLAADRMNVHVQSYYRVLDPSVFRAIRYVVEAAHAKEKWVGVCGELGGNTMAMPVLLGLGIDELSMSPQLINQAIYTIRKTTRSAARSLAEKVISLDSQESIVTLLSKSSNSKE